MQFVVYIKCVLLCVRFVGTLSRVFMFYETFLCKIRSAKSAEQHMMFEDSLTLLQRILADSCTAAFLRSSGISCGNSKGALRLFKKQYFPFTSIVITG